LIIAVAEFLGGAGATSAKAEAAIDGTFSDGRD
jgi:hypothetical protein